MSRIGPFRCGNRRLCLAYDSPALERTDAVNLSPIAREASVKARCSRAVFIFVLMALITAPVVAHHGTASFDTSKDVTLKGTVTDWIWANPHCFLKFDAMDETGTVRNWAVEVSNPTDMTKRGWARSSFKVGDAVTVNLQPVKNGAPIGRLRNVVLPDGSTLTAMGPPPGAAVSPQ